MDDSWVSVEQAAMEHSVDPDELAMSLNSLADRRHASDYLQIGLERRLVRDGSHVAIYYRRSDVEAALAQEAVTRLIGG